MLTRIARGTGSRDLELDLRLKLCSALFGTLLSFFNSLLLSLADYLSFSAPGCVEFPRGMRPWLMGEQWSEEFLVT